MPQTELRPSPDTAHLRPEDMAALSARKGLADADLADFFDNSFDLMCVAGLDGYFKNLNPAWTTCLGWTLEELQGQPFIDFVHPDDRERTLEQVAWLVEGAETILFDNRYRRRDGQFTWLQWNARFKSDGEQIFATARDITRQKLLERENLEILDHERWRLGRELHDGLGQCLAGIAAMSTRLSRMLAAKSEFGASAIAAEITQLLHDSIGEARDLARGLGPVGLDETELDQSLGDLAHNVGRLFKISCALECDGRASNLSHEVKTHLYRIAQEAAHNGVIHGGADQITIGLRYDGGKLILSVRDNGVGVPETLRHDAGIGMHTMAYRSRVIGGSLDVRRRSRRGTEVTCVCPWPNAANKRAQPDHVASSI